MLLRYIVDIHIKNDAITQESDRYELAMMVQDNLEDNKVKTLPWVVAQHYYLEPIPASDE